jgi:hypothetical protein
VVFASTYKSKNGGKLIETKQIRIERNKRSKQRYDIKRKVSLRFDLFHFMLFRFV